MINPDWKLDKGIEPMIRVLLDNGVETTNSCQGGIGHAYCWPIVQFKSASYNEVVKVAQLLMNEGFLVADVGLTTSVLLEDVADNITYKKPQGTIRFYATGKRGSMVVIGPSLYEDVDKVTKDLKLL